MSNQTTNQTVRKTTFLEFSVYHVWAFEHKRQSDKNELLSKVTWQGDLPLLFPSLLVSQYNTIPFDTPKGLFSDSSLTGLSVDPQDNFTWIAFAIH